MKNSNSLKPQDIVVLLAILSKEGNWQSKEIASAIGISPSEVSESLKRCHFSRLLDSSKKSVHKMALYDFLLHGVKYAFPVHPAETTRGIATAHSASPLNSHIISGEEQYIWPYYEGTDRGQAITPLYPSVAKTLYKVMEYSGTTFSFKDSNAMTSKEYHHFYEYLTLVDAVRTGRAREINLAQKILKQRLLNDE